MAEKTTKGLFSFLFEQMNKLDEGKIDVETAVAQSKLAKQANNVLDYELRRTKLLMEMKDRGENVEVELRDIETSPDDGTRK